MGALGKTFKYLKPYWKLVLLSMVMLLIVVAFDLLIPRLTQRAIDEGINAGDLQIVISSALLMLGASLLSALFAIINSTASIVASQRFSHDLREALFSKIQQFSFGNLDHLGTGELLVNLTSDMNMVEMAARMLMRIATRAPLMMFGALFMIFRTSTFLGYRVLIIMGVVVALIGFLIPRLQKLFTSVQQKLDKLNTVLQENISGMRVVKSFVRQDYEEQRFEAANEDFTRLNITTGRLLGGLFPLMFFILNIGIVIPAATR